MRTRLLMPILAMALGTALTLTACSSLKTPARSVAAASSVQIPDVSGLPSGDAKDALRDLGFNVDIVASDGSVVIIENNWSVVGITPAAGSSVDAGTKVTLTVEKTSEEAPAAGAPAAPVAPAAPAAPAAPSESVSQQNAREKAQEYLSFTSFSRTGLIGQLEFEGFSTPDATYGVDALNVDWNAQAALKAADYLSFTSFSHSGLVDQLVFDGFTPEQAEYGVSTTGL